MKTDDFLELKLFSVHKGMALIPANAPTQEWLELLKHNDCVNMKLVESRDLSFHRCYFALLAFIYDRMPVAFKNKIPKDSFYNFLKMLSNEYETVFEFQDGRKFIEYKSISFGKMSQTSFKEYVNNQLSVIYEELLIPLEIEFLMETINDEFQRFIDKLL